VGERLLGGRVLDEDVDAALSAFGVGKVVCRAEVFRIDVVDFAQDLPDELLFEIRRMLEVFFVALYPQLPVFHLPSIFLFDYKN